MTKNLALFCCAFMFAGLCLTGCSPTKSNSAPSGITLSSATVNEDAAANTLVGVFKTLDADAGDAFTYALIAGTGATDNASFAIRKDSLFTAVSFDYNVKKSCSIRVETKDQAGATFDTAFSVTIAHINHAPTGISLSNSTIADTLAIGTLVGTLSAADKDAADGHAFTLVSGAGADDNANFTISHDSLLVKTVPDGSIKHSCAVRVKAQDDSGASVDSAFIITVVHVKYPPSNIFLSDSVIDESAAAGSTVGLLSAYDRDSTGGKFIFTLVGGDTSKFEIAYGALNTKVQIPYDSLKNTFTVVIKVSNANGAFQKSFTIKVKKTLVIDGAAIFSERPLSSTSVTLAYSMQYTGTYYNWTPYDHFEGIKAAQFTVNDSTLSTVSFMPFMPDSFTLYANGKLHVALMGSVDIAVGIASAATDTNHIYVKATDYGYLPDGKWHEVWVPISVWASYVDLTAVTMIAGFKCPATPGGTNVIGAIYTVDDIYVTKQ